MVRHISAVAVAALASLAPVVSGCSDGGTEPIEVGVGPEGGSFALLDSLIVISVPAGAVASRVVLTGALESTAPTNPLLVPGTAVRLGPSGTTFAQPITITVRYGALVASLPAGVRESELRIGKVVGSAWTYPGGSPTIDEGQNRLSATFTSFSVFGIVAVPAATVTLSPGAAATTVGNSVSLTAEVRDADDVVLPDRVVSWSSLEPAIATVTGGSVNGVSAGVARIVASAEGKADTVEVTVSADPGGGAEPVFVEDFSTYSSTANFLSDPRGIYQDAEDFRTDRIFLDEAVGFGGSSKSMRYDYPSGTGTDYTVSRMLEMPTGTSQEVWVEVTIRFTPDFTIAGNGQGAGPALKLMHVEQNGVAGRFGLNFEGSSLRAEGPNDQYDPLYITTGVSVSTIFNGDWHTIRYHVRLGANDFHEVWVDGVHRGSKEANSAANNLWGIALARNLNMLSDRAMSMWWGRVRIWNANPGW